MNKNEFIKSDLVEYLMFITSRFVVIKTSYYLSRSEEYHVICLDNSEYFISVSELIRYFSNRKSFQKFPYQF